MRRRIEDRIEKSSEKNQNFKAMERMSGSSTAEGSDAIPYVMETKERAVKVVKLDWEGITQANNYIWGSQMEGRQTRVRRRKRSSGPSERNTRQRMKMRTETKIYDNTMLIRRR